MLLKKQSKCILYKVFVCVVALMVLVVPFTLCASADTIDGIPTEAFTCYYYDLESGEMVTTPEFSALPTVMATSTGAAFFKDYIIVKSRDVNGGVAYLAYMFCEDVEPTSVDITYSFNKTNTKMDEAIEAVKLGMAMDAPFDALWGTFVERFGQPGSFVPVLNEIFFIGCWQKLWNEGNAEIAMMNSESYWNRVLAQEANNRALLVYPEYCGDGVHPWLDITMTYSGKIQSHIAYYMEASGKWQWLTAYAPSQAYTYSINGVEAVVSSSFSFAGSTALSGSKNGFVNDVVEDLEQDLQDNTVKAPLGSSPSWDEGMIGDGDTSIGDSFVSGSWYNDAGTGNPFVAAFVAPWVGINWTYENVATEISLFGVSVADVVATGLLLIASAFVVVMLIKVVAK